MVKPKASSVPVFFADTVYVTVVPASGSCPDGEMNVRLRVIGLAAGMSSAGSSWARVEAVGAATSRLAARAKPMRRGGWDMEAPRKVRWVATASRYQAVAGVPR